MTFYAYIVRRMRLCKLCHPLRNPIINLNGNQRVIVTSISPTGRLDGAYFTNIIYSIIIQIEKLFLILRLMPFFKIHKLLHPLNVS